MDIRELVTTYGQKDEEFKELKKECDDLKDNLKMVMTEMDSSRESYGGYIVTKTVSNRETFNEEKALEILKHFWNTHKSPADKCPYVKTIEVLDMEALETSLYNHELSDDIILELDKCRKVTEVVTLKCAKAKKGA